MLTTINVNVNWYWELIISKIGYLTDRHQSSKLHWIDLYLCARAQWLRGRALDSRLQELRFESCAVVLKPWASFSLYIAPVHSAV